MQASINSKLDVTIRQVAREDLPKLEQALTQVFPEDGHIIARYVEEIFEKVKPFSYIALLADSIIGFAIACVEDRYTGHILYIGVVEQYRRRKIGTRLMCATLRRLFESLDIEKVFLEVKVGNTSAILFYKKFGFTIVRRVPKYYIDGSDCYIMELYREVYERVVSSLCSTFQC